jgi:hypothetical protein
MNQPGPQGSHRTQRLVRAVLAAAITLTGASAAATNYFEGTSGDLSNARGAPTPVLLSVGNNLIDGQHGAGDLDYVAITLPAGVTLDEIIVQPSTTFAGTRSFIGVQAGPVMTVDPANPVVSQLLGYTHFDFGSINADILAEMGLAAGTQMFTPPLGTGAERTYTFWIQETGATTAHYQLNFRTRAATAVPALGALGSSVLAGALVLLGLASLRARKGA